MSNTGPAPNVRVPLSPAVGMLIVCLIWGVNFSVLKYALGYIGPYGLTAIRFAIASVVLWFVARALEPGAPLSWGLRFRLAGLGVLGNTAYQLSFMLGLTRTTAGNSSLLIASTPLVTALLGVGLGVEKLTRGVRIAVGVGTLGVLLVVLDSGRRTGFSLETMSGDLLTLLAVLCWSLFTHGVTRVQARTSPLRVTAWTVIGGTPVLLLVGLPELMALDWGALPLLVWGAIGYAALFSIVIAYALWSQSVRAVGGSRTALFGVTVPVVALATALLLLGEVPTPIQLLGAGLIVTSVILNVRAHS